MQYRPFGNKNFEVSTFGMGCMRPPMKRAADGAEVIDREEYIRMIQYAVDHGVTYLDTAYVYCGGDSERMVGEALSQGGRRDKVKIATKCPVWLAENKQDLWRMFEEECEKLQTKFIDIYLLHSLDQEHYAQAEKAGCFEFLDELKAAGRIGMAAFSFHDQYELFCQILDRYDWDMCQLQLNVIDTDYQATLEGMRKAAARGMAVVIMEPLRGGMLANVPGEVQAIYDEAPVRRSPAEWAFRFMYNFPEVTTILSGVSNQEQLEDNLRIFDKAQAGVMDEAEQALIARVKAYFDDQIRVRCTGCAYCMPCPQGVKIPDLFSSYNRASMFGAWDDARKEYGKQLQKGEDTADLCVQCGACEAECPQHLSIMELLQQVHTDLAK